MDTITYALCKKAAASAVSGVKSMSVDGQTLTINTKDSGVLKMVFPTPSDGHSVTDIDVDDKNQIVFTMSDGTKITSGVIPTVKGADGKPGKDGKAFTYDDFTDEQLEALKVKGDKGDPGSDAFSPTITENENNTDKIYKLDVTTADGTFTTPNLKGKDGTGSSTGEENVIESIKVNGVVQTVADDKSVDITVPTVEGLVKSEDLATVATSGSYNDLTDTPSIPNEYDDTALKNRVVTIETNIGDMSTIKIKSVSDLVSAINALHDSFMSGITYADKKLAITYRNGGKVEVDLSPIIKDTNVSELNNVDDTGVTDKQVLAYDFASSKYKPISIDLVSVLQDSKDYTDAQISKINSMDAYAVDEKPTYSDGTITYKKNGETLTTENSDIWFYYTVDDMNYQTLFIDGVEFTVSVDGDVDFKDFVSKSNDLADTYTGEEVDKTKVTTLGALDALYEIVATAIGKKVNTEDIVDDLNSDSVDKPLSAHQGKVLDGKIAENATAIEEIQTDLETRAKSTEVDEKIEKINQATKEQFGTASGEFIHIEDAVNGNIVELGVKGESIQNQYVGKNLITYPFSQTTQTKYGVTFTDNKNGSINISGTQDGTENRPYMGLGIWWNETDKKTGNIPISANTDFTISPNCGSNTAGIRYYVYDESGTKLADATVYGTATKTLKFDVDVWVSLCVETAANSAAYSCGCKPQLELGTTATNFEPYVGGVASPSPDYPQNITSIGDNGSLVITSCGKNILSSVYYQQSGELNGITWTVNSDGTVTANGTATGSGSSFNYIYAFGSSTRKKLVLGHTYKFSDGVEKSLAQNIYTQLIRYNQVTNTFNWGLSTRGTNSFVANDENLLSYGLRTVIDAGITVDNLVIKPQILIDIDSDDFELYKSSSATISLSVPLRSIGDVKDEITYQNGKLGIQRRVGKITVDGTNGKINFVSINKDTTGVIQCNIAGMPDVVKKQIGAKLLCTRFRWSNVYPGTASAPTSDIDVSNTVYEYAAGVIAVRLPLTITEVIDVATANTYFSTHSFDLLYELATPTFEIFADQSIPYSLMTYKEVTNIYNDSLAEMNVKYPLTDSAASGTKNEAKIAELESELSEKISTDGVYEALKLQNISTDSIKDFLLTNTKVGTYVVKPTVTGMPIDNAWWMLTVEKAFSNNTSYKVTASRLSISSAMYYMIYNAADNNYYKGWTKIAVTNVEDVPTTQVDLTNNEEITGVNSTVIYTVKNGICYVEILNIQFKTADAVANAIPVGILPKAINDNFWFVLCGVTNSSLNMLVSPNSDGGLTHHITDTTQIYTGSFSYPVAES